MWSPYLYKSKVFDTLQISEDILELYWAAIGSRESQIKLKLTQEQSLYKLRDISMDFYNRALVKILTFDGWHFRM